MPRVLLLVLLVFHLLPDVLGLAPGQAIFSVKVGEIEQRLDATFRKEIGADCSDDTVTYDSAKKVFMASVKVGPDQFVVKAFKLKADAQHWAGLVTSLQRQGRLRGHLAVIQAAEANRKATQDCFDRIMKGDGLLQPEDNPAFQQSPSKGKDVWSEFFAAYAEKHPTLKFARVRVHKGTLEELLVKGSQKPMIAELLAWQRKTLGWRVTRILTHANEEGAQKAVRDFVQQSADLTHVGFIRLTADATTPVLTPDDIDKLKRIYKSTKEALVAVVGYKTCTGDIRAWEWDPTAPGPTVPLCGGGIGHCDPAR